MDYKAEIAKLLANENINENELAESIAESEFADFALPCFKLAGKLKKSPVAIAEEFKDKFIKNLPQWAEKAEALNGYLNISLNRFIFIEKVLNSFKDRGADWENKKNNGKTVVIDYSSINIAKDFHIGHLMSTAIGGSLYKIFKFLGYQTIGVNHLGDFGTQFGKLIAAYKKWGGPDMMENLTALYVRFHKEEESNPGFSDEGRAWFKKIEEGDKEALRLFNLFKEITLHEVNKVYKLLGIEFDSYNGESFYNDKMRPVIELLEQKNLLTESEGAKVVDLSKFDMPPCLILKSDGASLYATRDLAAAIYRQNTYGFNQNLYIVAYQQNLHFKQVFKVLELMGFEWAAGCRHIPFGMVSIEGLGALSTRKGNVIKLKDVLNTAIEKTRAVIEAKNPLLENKDKVSEQVGVGAVVFNALYNSRIKDTVFSYEKALSFEGETGPYIQYTHARCCSVLSKCEPVFDIDVSVLTDDVSYQIIKLLSRFDNAVECAAKEYEPSIVSRYLIDLSKAYNKFYIEHRILGEEQTVMQARIKLTEYVKNTLKNGMKLILLQAPEKM